PVALRENEAAHLGIPTTGLVAEVDSGGQQCFDGRLIVSHWVVLLSVWFCSSAPFAACSHRVPPAPRAGSRCVRDELPELRLALAELDPLACAGPAGLLALHGARVARQEAKVTQLLAMRLFDLDERTSDREAQRPRLTRLPATLEIGLHVVAA